MSDNLLSDVQKALNPESKGVKPPKQYGLGAWTYDDSPYSMDNRQGHDYYPDAGYGGSVGKKGYQHPPAGGKDGHKYTKGPTTTVSVNRKVAVVWEDKSQQVFTVPYDAKDWFELAKAVWPVEGDTVWIPFEHCLFTHETPVFNACVYTASGDYIQARWGRKLDDSDKRWLAAHPLATDNGIPQEYTATAVDQLVQPYGMRVSRIRIRRGSLVLGESTMGWLHALGCNPFALLDRQTTNAEAAAKIGIPVEQANEIWRVEFHDQALPCSIVGERGWSNTSSVTTGSFGGHAKYLAPRAYAGDWFVSLQLDLESNVQHLVAPPNPEYIPRKGRPVLQLAGITGPDKKLIAEKRSGKWVGLGQAVDTASATTNVVVYTPPSPTQDALLPQLGEGLPFPSEHDATQSSASVCVLCESPLGGDEDYADARLCDLCVDDAWSGYFCVNCGDKFALTGAPELVGFDPTSTTWVCGACHDEFTVLDASLDKNDELLKTVILTVTTSDYDLTYPEETLQDPFSEI